MLASLSAPEHAYGKETTRARPLFVSVRLLQLNGAEA